MSVCLCVWPYQGVLVANGIGTRPTYREPGHLSRSCDKWRSSNATFWSVSSRNAIKILVRHVSDRIFLQIVVQINISPSSDSTEFCLWLCCNLSIALAIGCYWVMTPWRHGSWTDLTWFCRVSRGFCLAFAHFHTGCLTFVTNAQGSRQISSVWLIMPKKSILIWMDS